MPRFKRTPTSAAACCALTGALVASLAGPAAAATFNWSGGTFVPGITAPSPLVLGDLLNIQTASSKSFSAVSFVNAGTVNWLASSSNLSLLSASSLSNTGLWDAQGDAALVFGGGASSTFTNSGTLRKSGGAGTTLIGNSSAVNVVNSGTVDAQTGTVMFSGTNTFNTGTVFTGAGSVVVNSSSSFVGAFTSSNLTVAGGTQTGSGAVLNGLARYSAGTVAGDWAVAAGATLDLQGAGTKTLATANVVNTGTLAWQASSSNIGLLSGTSLVNNGLVDAQGDAALVFAGGSTSTFTNNGTLRKSGGAGTTLIGNSSAVNVVNSGMVDAQTGTIMFSGANTFSAGTVFTGAGSVVVNSASTFSGSFTSSNLTVAGGTQTGSGALLNGQMQYTAGTLAGDWTVAPGATLNVQGAGTKTLATANVTNTGTVAWQASSGNIGLLSGTSVVNNGLFDAQGDAALVFAGGVNSTFINNGTLRKSGGAGTTLIGNSSAVNVVNNGTVDAQTGTVMFSGTNTFNAGTVFTGAGSVVVNSASTFSGAFTSSNLSLDAGTQTGSGAVLNGQARYKAGTLAGDWAVATGATLNVQGGGSKTLNGANVVNNGTLAWQASSGNIGFLSGTSVVNNGLVDAQGDAALVFAGGAASSFTNNGTVRKSGGAGTTLLTNSGALGFVNNGTVDVQVGTIELPSNFTNAGTLTGSGTLRAPGVLTNDGTLAPGSFGAGTLALVGGALAQTASSTFAVDLTSMAAFDLLTVAGATSLSGTLALNCLGACSFSVGDTFTILNATGALTGTFASVTLTGFTGGAFSVIYDTANSDVRLLVTQTVTAVPEPGTYAMLLAGLGVLGGAARRRRSLASTAA
jgi:fibronectin-binding autotransporter adhesin